jgi:hydrogenase expression/formation protein HypC
MTDDSPTCHATDGCITCGDVAVALTVIERRGSDAWCRDDEGRTELVAVEFVTDAASGDRLLVHAGVALERLQPIDLRGESHAFRR